MASEDTELTGGDGPGGRPASPALLAGIGLFVVACLSSVLYCLHLFWPRCEPELRDCEAERSALSGAGTHNAPDAASSAPDGGSQVLPAMAARAVDAGAESPDASSASTAGEPDAGVAAAPLGPIAITDIIPPVGSTCGGEVVRVEGIGFVRDSTRITFGGLPAKVDVEDGTTLLATLPPHWESTVDVSVSVDRPGSGESKPAIRPNAFGYVCRQRTQSRLLLLVMLAGALGGALHALRSLYDFIGRRMLLASWLAMYIALPFCGAAIGTVFFLVYMAGFYTPNGTDNKNFFGMIGASALVGLFSAQAVEKLKKISEAILTTPPPAPDKAPPEQAPLMLREVEPKQTSSRQRITILGSGFRKGVKVAIGGLPAQDAQILSGTKLSVEAPEHPAGKVSVEVLDENGNRAVLAQGVEYVDAPPGKA